MKTASIKNDSGHLKAQHLGDDSQIHVTTAVNYKAMFFRHQPAENQEFNYKLKLSGKSKYLFP